MAIERALRIDPVTLEVLRNALPAIANEMSVDLQRTSYNMMIYEVRDYCCAILDADGRLISQNLGGVSHFVSDLGVVIKEAIAEYGRDGFAPGDVILHNHQRSSGQHLNNMCVYTPFFFRDELLCFAVVRAHWVDVGGQSTGFGSVATVTDPWMEGLQLEHVKLYEAGVQDRKIWKLIGNNIRYPESSLGDLRSQMAACKLGERRLEEVFSRYGKATILAGLERIYDETEARCRAAVEQIPDGEYTAESFLDSQYGGRSMCPPWGLWNGLPGAASESMLRAPGETDFLRTERSFAGEARLPIRVRVIVSGSDMTVDLTGCSPQVRAGINSRTLAAPYIAYKGVTAPLDPVNEGSFRALKVDIQEGNLMMARFGAPMTGWSVPLPTVVDTILKALAPALPERIPAAHLGSLGGVLTFFGYDRFRSRNFLFQTIEGGGWGGRPWEDGPDASVSVCQGDVRNAPIETIELKNPVLVVKRGLRDGSGGAGKFRGGLGQHLQVRNLVEGRWNGASGRFVGEGSEAIMRSAGGGGWGDPLERDPARVGWDVLEGYISLDNARDDYGVVLDAESLEIDSAATQTLRAERLASRLSALEANQGAHANGRS